MSLAPIVLFVYNRLEHTKQTIEALQNNTLAAQSELFIYSDGPKNEATYESVQEVREYINQIKGFKELHIIMRESNYGLTKNIASGVTEIINKYNRVIVLEDDIVTSKYFLEFMNDALNYYEDKKEVWHISGYNYPVSIRTEEDTYFSSLMDCWGWATWKDRWQYFSLSRKILWKILFLPGEQRKKFDLWGAEIFMDQLYLNLLGLINTWAIFWYAQIFLNSGLCLHPAKSLINNIGHDKSGENCEETNLYYHEKFCEIYPLRFTDSYQINEEIVRNIGNYLRLHKTPFSNKMLKLLKILKKNFFGQKT
ncbi:MAG: glycosyltransferase family A protein [Brevinematales bacterium]